MSFWTAAFVIAVIAIVAGLITTWMHTRHDGKTAGDAPSKQEFDAIGVENRELRQQVADLTRRLTVLERIATDPAERVAREIDELR